MKFLLSTPWTVVRFIKLKSPTVRERYAANWGTLQQPIQAEHRQAGDLSGACSTSCWRIAQNFSLSLSLSLSLSSFSSRYLSLCWWSILTECENGCIATVLLSRSPLPWLFWCGRLLEETLWRLLFIGKGHSHICIWSLWETERMREKHEGYSQFSKRNNLSCHPSHFSLWTNKGRKGRGEKGGSVRETLSRFSFSCI